MVKAALDVDASYVKRSSGGIRTFSEQSVQKNFHITNHAKILDTQVSVSKKADIKEEKAGDIVLEVAEFPKVRRFTLDKFIDKFYGTERD